MLNSNSINSQLFFWFPPAVQIAHVEIISVICFVYLFNVSFPFLHVDFEVIQVLLNFCYFFYEIQHAESQLHGCYSVSL